MDGYDYACVDAEWEQLAHVICDLFPEQTRFVEQQRTDGPILSVQWLAMRFGAAPRRMVLEVRITRAALVRYQAAAPLPRARSHAVLRAYVEAALGSLEEQYARGDTLPREVEVELGDVFA